MSGARCGTLLCALFLVKHIMFSDTSSAIFDGQSGSLCLFKYVWVRGRCASFLFFCFFDLLRYTSYASWGRIIGFLLRNIIYIYGPYTNTYLYMYMDHICIFGDQGSNGSRVQGRNGGARVQGCKGRRGPMVQGSKGPRAQGSKGVQR